MDISVNRLNNRMALQVPPELPLGLVFIVGRVMELRAPGADTRYVHFDLVDGGHRLRCRLPARVAQETLLSEGDRIRVGGQLAFDARSARYCLQARDLEVLSSGQEEASLQQIISDVQQRSKLTALAHSELPPWVQKLAPPEVRRQLGLVDGEEAVQVDQSEPSEPLVAGFPAPPLSSDALIFLSRAIDSDDDVELTAEIVAEYAPGESNRRSREKEAKPDQEPSQETEPSFLVGSMAEAVPGGGDEDRGSLSSEELPFDLGRTATLVADNARRSRLRLLAVVSVGLLILLSIAVMTLLMLG